MESKYQALLADKNIRRWYENTARGSPITADICLRRLGGFCNARGVTPQSLVKMSDKRIYNLLLDTIGEMERQGSAGGYIASVTKAVKSWLAFNDRTVTRKLRIRRLHERPTLQNERVPTQDELRAIFLAAEDKARAVCVLIGHSGLRPEVLGNYKGTDGLRISDLPELEIQGTTVTFAKVPTLIRVRSSLSKRAHEYFTFLGDEGCGYLKAYFETRLRAGEPLASESAAITPKNRRKPFIRTNNIGDAARGAIRGAGLPWRPYVLRSYFDTQLMLAESKGLIIRDFRAFFMGHQGDIEAVYTLNKRKLPPNVVEQMRDSYRKAMKFLQTTGPGHTEEELTRAFKRQLLLVAGFKADEIRDDQLDLNDDEFQRLVRARLSREMKVPGPTQKVVSIEAVEEHLIKGWEFVGSLPNNRAILKLAG